MFIFKFYFYRMFFITKANEPSLRIGSNYGGWWISTRRDLHKRKVLSIGAGEDLSFDAELANEFDCQISIYDPTPRAIIHYNNFKKSIGKPAELRYSKNGLQPIAAYNLLNATQRNFIYYDKAIWIETGTIKFFTPQNSEHVSHSITGYEQKILNSDDFIIVECIDIGEIAIDKFEIIKLDVEGAEISILNRMIFSHSKDSLPHQILVEYDLLKIPKFANFQAVFNCNKLLLQNGFVLCYVEGLNFTYLKNTI